MGIISQAKDFAIPSVKILIKKFKLWICFRRKLELQDGHVDNNSRSDFAKVLQLQVGF